MRKRTFLVLALALTLCATTGHAALLQGGSGSQQGVRLTTPQPTQVSNTVKGLGLSGNTTQTTVKGSEPTLEPTVEPVATVEPTLEPTTESEAPKTARTQEEIAQGETYAVKGYAEFEVVIRLDEDSRIVFMVVPTHGETPGLGAAVIEEEETFAALEGMYIGDAQVDAVAGATLTVNALNDAIRQAAESHHIEWIGMAAQGETVKETEAVEVDETQAVEETKDTGRRL